ncbi:hypothetical protein [Calidithermus roseus]|uniref:hypothetical protein n=1 Tax=Calidithermus roseus TaxID=1644118 RepID=UPI0011C3D45F|nr:hypothetical protein [Calidithermus roseus]
METVAMASHLDAITGLSELKIDELAYRLLCDSCETTKCCASGTDSCEDFTAAPNLSIPAIAKTSVPIGKVLAAYGRPW